MKRAEGVLPPVTNQKSRSRLKNESSWLGILLFASVVCTFLPAIQNEFVGYDDPLYVTGNSHVQEGLSWETLKWAFSSGEAANWHPITWLSHMLDYELFGLQAWGHHLTSLIFHALSTVLLFVALFFGLHPLRVESVAWVAERKDVLGTLFWMLTLWAYAEYTERKIQDPNTELSGEPVPGKRVTPRLYALRSTLHAITPSPCSSSHLA